jgi:hypothetical protein
MRRTSTAIAAGLQDNIAAMFPTRQQRGIGLAEKFVIIVAQRGKPADLARIHERPLRVGLAGGHSIAAGPDRSSKGSAARLGP